MDPYADHQPESAGRGMFVWILLITGILILSGFIPLILLGRASPLEETYRNCVEGESGTRIEGDITIEYDNGVPVAVRYPGIQTIPREVQQQCFDLIVLSSRYG